MKQSEITKYLAEANRLEEQAALIRTAVTVLDCLPIEEFREEMPLAKKVRGPYHKKGKPYKGLPKDTIRAAAFSIMASHGGTMKTSAICRKVKAQSIRTGNCRSLGRILQLDPKRRFKSVRDSKGNAHGVWTLA